MLKVFYTTDLREGPLVSGTTDGVRIDGFYLRVNDQLIFASNVFLDCQENHELLTAYREEYAMWKAQEPNPYALRNACKPIGE